MRAVLRRLVELLGRHFHSLHVGAHMSYFGMVFLEAHSTYGIIAGGLFILTLLGWVFNEGE